MKVTLVKNFGKPISLGVGRFCFPIEEGELRHNECSQIGSKINGKIRQYDEAYDLATLSWTEQIFDEIIDSAGHRL